MGSEIQSERAKQAQELRELQDTYRKKRKTAEQEGRSELNRVRGDNATGSTREVLSTLDPNQYPYYHPVKSSETVTYKATWKCRGNTSHFKAICPNPKAQN